MFVALSFAFAIAFVNDHSRVYKPLIQAQRRAPRTVQGRHRHRAEAPEFALPAGEAPGCDHRLPAHPGRAVQVDPIKPKLRN